MKKLGFVFNAARCNGCGACAIACKEEKGVPDDVWMRRRYENPHESTYLTMNCAHCEKPACLAACPVKAYAKDADGLVIQDHGKCIGCKACVTACPWGVPAYSETDKKVHKCDACAPRLAKGLPPACVAACPCGAIEFGPIEELRAKYPDAVVKGFAWAAAAFGMPGPERTDPNLVIVPFK